MGLYNAGFLFLAVYLVQCDAHKLGIISGEGISIKDVPYIASLRVDDNRHTCGGSIIHERFILTAAHCIQTHTYKVVVGTDKLDHGGKFYSVDKIFVNKDYDDDTNDNDVAVIKLSEPLKFSNKVAKIPLADDSMSISDEIDMQVIGWGRTKEGSGGTSNDLLEVHVPYISNRKCQKAYDYATPGVVITENMICAGTEGKDSCQGDSGGPLTQDGVQVGIVSFGTGCGHNPGVYSRVSALLPWINRVIAEEDNDDDIGSTNKVVKF